MVHVPVDCICVNDHLIYHCISIIVPPPGFQPFLVDNFSPVCTRSAASTIPLSTDRLKANKSSIQISELAISTMGLLHVGYHLHHMQGVIVFCGYATFDVYNEAFGVPSRRCIHFMSRRNLSSTRPAIILVSWRLDVVCPQVHFVHLADGTNTNYGETDQTSGFWKLWKQKQRKMKRP